MAKFEIIEQYGYNKQGVCINPFGIKPEWVQRLAKKIRQGIIIEQAEEALF
jgi:hypothetical protein